MTAASWVPIAAACAAGALVGVLYTLSPLTVWFAAAMGGLIAWAGRGLSRRERLWVFGLLGTAIALRLLAVAAMFLATRQVDGSSSVLIPDEAYMAYRARMLRFIALGVPLAGADYVEAAEPYGETGLHYIHAYVQLLVGEAPYALRLLHAALYLAGSVALYRAVRPSFGALPALGGLAVVLFTPSLFVWSITYLKDAPHQYLTLLSVAAAMAAVRSRTIAFSVLAWSLVAGLIWMLHFVRPGGEIIAGGGIAIGLLVAAALRRPVAATVMLTAALLAVAVGLRSASVQQRAAGLLAQAAQRHVGYVHTPGWNYKLLDPGFYARLDSGSPLSIDPGRFTPAAAARYVIRSTASTFLFPLPWQAASLPIRLYLPEQLLWTALLVLALVGVVSGLRVDAALTLTLAGIIALGVVVIGMTSGNLGTLIRHRAAMAVLLPWLGALGACQVLVWTAGLRAGAAPEHHAVVSRDEGVHAAY